MCARKNQALAARRASRRRSDVRFFVSRRGHSRPQGAPDLSLSLSEMRYRDIFSRVCAFPNGTAPQALAFGRASKHVHFWRSPLAKLESALEYHARGAEAWAERDETFSNASLCDPAAPVRDFCNALGVASAECFEMRRRRLFDAAYTTSRGRASFSCSPSALSLSREYASSLILSGTRFSLSASSLRPASGAAQTGAGRSVSAARRRARVIPETARRRADAPRQASRRGRRDAL